MFLRGAGASRSIVAVFHGPAKRVGVRLICGLDLMICPKKLERSVEEASRGLFRGGTDEIRLYMVILCYTDEIRFQYVSICFYMFLYVSLLMFQELLIRTWDVAL